MIDILCALVSLWLALGGVGLLTGLTKLDLHPIPFKGYLWGFAFGPITLIAVMDEIVRRKE